MIRSFHRPPIPGEDGHVAATSGGDGFTEDGEASSPS